MRKALLLYILCAVIALNLSAQTNFSKDYNPLNCTGALPKELTIRYTDKFNQEREKISNLKQSEKKTKESFIKQSTYLLNELLKSGHILFNEPLSNYVNKVAGHLLENDKATLAKINILVIKSTAVNAFTTNEGFIFVTTGLLAQLENEAQLAFTLSHEIVHFTEQHSMERYIETEATPKGAANYNRNTVSKSLLQKCLFNKEQEKEADEKGLQLFLKSPYSTKTLRGLFDVLKYAELPIDDIEFDPAFFENESFKFPSYYKITETKPINTADKPEEDESTHPSIKSRREKLAATTEKVSDEGKKDFIEPKEKFIEARELARFELARLYNLNEDYCEAIYHSYILLKKYPDNKYLKKNIAYALTAMVSFNNQLQFSDVYTTKLDSAEGKQQGLYIFIKYMSRDKSEFNAVALAYAAKLKTEYPEDKDIKRFYKHLITQLVTECRRDLDYFYTTPYDAVAEALKRDSATVTTTDTLANTGEVSKYDKLRAQETKQLVPVLNDAPEYLYYRYALVPYALTDSFKDDYTEIQIANKDFDHDAARMVTVEEGETKLGINEVTLVNPSYVKLNAEKREKFKYLESDKGQADFANRLLFVAKKAKLNASLLDSKNLKDGEIDKLNDVSFMSEYMSERLNQDNKANVYFPPLEKSRADLIAKKYQTANFMWNGAISFHDQNRYRPILIIYGILFPPVLPFILPALINGGNYTYIYTMVYDVERDRFKLLGFKSIIERTTPAVLNSHLYDVMKQVKSEDK